MSVAQERTETSGGLIPYKPAARALLVGLLAACSARQVAPGDTARPALEARVAADSMDGESVVRLAAAQAADGTCSLALETARRGIALRPQDALGPLVAGECLERMARLPDAIRVYETFLASHATTLGAPAVAARLLLAQREIATTEARVLVAREEAIATDTRDPNVLAVMPLEVVGDPAFGPLAYGIASLIESDLALVRQFTLVERTRLDALLQEIALGEHLAVDPSTAARAGRLLRAAGIVHGVTLIAPDQRIRFDVSVMDATSRVVTTESVSGRVDDLLRLEKDLVLRLIAGLNYQLSAAERALILANGPGNLAAFLAYSDGLLRQAEGEFGAAALSFARAVRADPNFRQARQAHRANAAVPAVREAGAGSATTLAQTATVNAATVATTSPLGGALASGVQDVAPTIGETLNGGSTGQQAASTPSTTAPPATSGILTRVFTFGMTIVFRFP